MIVCLVHLQLELERKVQLSQLLIWHCLAVDSLSCTFPIIFSIHVCTGQSGEVFSYQMGDFMKDVVKDGMYCICVHICMFVYVQSHLVYPTLVYLKTLFIRHSAVNPYHCTVYKLP